MPLIRNLLLGLGIALLAVPAAAELSISQLVVELKPGAARAADLEVFNDSPERSYVSVEPREILGAGTAEEKPLTSPDPDKLGLLASPARMVLEPGQRRRLRIAYIGAEGSAERVYRVTVKPVSGEVKSEENGLKLLVGYDLLVLVRPATIATDIAGTRSGSELVLTNRGTSSVELADGKQCDADGKNCQPLPGKRLYAGASWRQPVRVSAKIEYRARSASGWSVVKF